MSVGKIYYSTKIATLCQVQVQFRKSSVNAKFDFAVPVNVPTTETQPSSLDVASL